MGLIFLIQMKLSSSTPRPSCMKSQVKKRQFQEEPNGKYVWKITRIKDNYNKTCIWSKKRDLSQPNPTSSHSNLAPAPWLHKVPTDTQKYSIQD